MTDGIGYHTAGTSALKPQHETRRLSVYRGGLEGGGATVAHERFRVAPLAIAVVLCVAALAAAWCASSIDATRAAKLYAALDAAPHEVVYVQPGDTLWSIASEGAGARTSTERVVSWIMEANGLPDASLKPGTRLVIPVLAP